MNTPTNDSQTHSTDENAVLAARRKKFDQIVEMGIDPWGQRFDDRDLLGDIRKRQSEIKFLPATGQPIDLPAELDSEDFDFRGWLKEQGEAH